MIELKTKQMKECLKAAGYDVSKISIRHRWGGYSEVYNVTIKTTEYDVAKIRKLLWKYEEVDRDERTGETLMGGNTYVFVDLDWRLRGEAFR